MRRGRRVRGGDGDGSGSADAAADGGGAGAAGEGGLARPDPATALARRRAPPEARAPQDPQQGMQLTHSLTSTAVPLHSLRPPLRSCNACAVQLSAKNSRIKKQEYVEAIESRLRAAETRNDFLLMRIAALEKANRCETA